MAISVLRRCPLAADCPSTAPCRKDGARPEAPKLANATLPDLMKNLRSIIFTCRASITVAEIRGNPVPVPQPSLLDQKHLLRDHSSVAGGQHLHALQALP